MKRVSLVKIRTFVIAGLGVVALAAYTGFPRRVGLTRSQAAISLPGDLVLAGANIVVDRGIEIEASASTVWAVITAAFGGNDSDVIDCEEGSHIITRVETPGVAGRDGDGHGTSVLALEPVTDNRTLLHIRERHLVHSHVDAVTVKTLLAAQIPSALCLLRDIRRAACAMERRHT